MTTQLGVAVLQEVNGGARLVKTVELRRHTASDGDRLTPKGIAAAVEIGSRFGAPYDLLISSGAQRATQTLACFLAGSGQRSPAGVTVDETFRSTVEERWFSVARLDRRWRMRSALCA